MVGYPLIYIYTLFQSHYSRPRERHGVREGSTVSVTVLLCVYIHRYKTRCSLHVGIKEKITPIPPQLTRTHLKRLIATSQSSVSSMFSKGEDPPAQQAAAALQATRDHWREATTTRPAPARSTLEPLPLETAS